MYATEEQARILRQAVAAIKLHPETFDMTFWSNSCGTICCLAGQVVRNHVTAGEWFDYAQRQHADQAKPISEWTMPIRREAERLLGLDEDTTERLFMHCEWPEQFLTIEYDEDENDGSRHTRLPTADQLESRVEHWIATGE